MPDAAPRYAVCEEVTHQTVFFFLSFLTPKCLLQVEEGGRASLAGVQDGDEVVSINGEPCADLTLLQAFALIDTSIDCLQLLVRR